MCKIAVIPKITKKTVTNAWKFAIEITPYLTKHDNDGFGYMALGNQGIFGERWLHPNQAWRLRDQLSPQDRKILNQYQDALSGKSGYNSFGKSTQNITCLALHARMATCGKGLINTHPFVSNNGETVLIHNGVVQADITKYRNSTCDSETILTLYNELNITEKLNNINSLADRLQGYFACAVITRDGNNWYLDIFKDSTARLSAIWVTELDSLVFCTDLDIVKTVCRKLKWHVGTEFEVSDNVIMRHDALNGNIIECVEFERDIYSTYSSSSKYEVDSIDISKLKESIDDDDDIDDLVDIMNKDSGHYLKS